VSHVSQVSVWSADFLADFGCNLADQMLQTLQFLAEARCDTNNERDHVTANAKLLDIQHDVISQTRSVKQQSANEINS
jgi:hypothetical protein